jgi:diaminopimelate epimerase
MQLEFTKMSGAGNDFVVFDGRRGTGREVLLGDTSAFVREACHRRFGIGADGVLIVEEPTAGSDADFRMRYFNADGGEAEMCGNGARCISRYALRLGLGRNGAVRFDTEAGRYSATLAGDEVRVSMLPPRDVRTNVKVNVSGQVVEGTSLNTGVPHFVVFAPNVTAVDVVGLGRALRRHEAFAPAGTNVDFVQRVRSGLRVRTYERGVEDETLACGTGLTASALAGALAFDLPSPIVLRAESGQDLRVYFERVGESFHDVTLEGEGRFVFEGTYDVPAHVFGGGALEGASHV